MYVCMYACLYVCMYVCMYVYIYIYIILYVFMYYIIYMILLPNWWIYKYILPHPFETYAKPPAKWHAMPVDTWPLEKTYIQISHLPRNISQAETAANIAWNDTLAMTAPQSCNVTDAAMPNPSHPQPQNTKSSQTDLDTSGFVWKCCVPHCTQWFCWSLSLWKMAISLGILTQHFQVQTQVLWWLCLSCKTNL